MKVQFYDLSNCNALISKKLELKFYNGKNFRMLYKQINESMLLFLSFSFWKNDNSLKEMDGKNKWKKNYKKLGLNEEGIISLTFSIKHMFLH